MIALWCASSDISDIESNQLWPSLLIHDISILITIIFSQLQSKHDSYELFLFHNCIWIPQWCLMLLLNETMHYHLAVKWYFQLAKAFYSCWWTKRAQQHCEKLYEHRKFLRDIIKKYSLLVINVLPIMQRCTNGIQEMHQSSLPFRWWCPFWHSWLNINHSKVKILL